MVRALVVEDNAEMRFILDQMLRSLATEQVDRVSSLAEARAALFRHQYDFALVDVGLKNENGLDLVREVRQNADHRANNLPFVVVSGQNQASVVCAARDAGADHFITKPLSIYALSEKLACVLKARGVSAAAKTGAVVSRPVATPAADSSDDEIFL